MLVDPGWETGKADLYLGSIENGTEYYKLCMPSKQLHWEVLEHGLDEEACAVGSGQCLGGAGTGNTRGIFCVVDWGQSVCRLFRWSGVCEADGVIIWDGMWL